MLAPRTPQRQHLQVPPSGLKSPTSIPRPTFATPDRKHESVVNHSSPARPKSRLSSYSPSPSTCYSTPRPKSRVSERDVNAYTPFPTPFPSSYESSSAFQTDVDETETFFRPKSTKIPCPTERQVSGNSKQAKVKSRRYLKSETIGIMLLKVGIYYRSKRITAQVEKTFKVVESQMPTRYLNTASQLTPPPSRSREGGNTKGHPSVPEGTAQSKVPDFQGQRPPTPPSCNESPASSGYESPTSMYSTSPSSRSHSNNTFKDAPSPIDIPSPTASHNPIYCDELKSSPLSASPPQTPTRTSHEPTSVQSPMGTILLPIVEVSESHTGASGYPKRRRYEPVESPQGSVSSSAYSEYSAINIPTFFTPVNGSLHNLNSTQQSNYGHTDPASTSTRTPSPTHSNTAFYRSYTAATEILAAKKERERGERGHPCRIGPFSTTASSAVSISSKHSPELEAATATSTTAKGEFCLVPKLTESCGNGDKGAVVSASGALERSVTHPRRRAQSLSSLSAHLPPTKFADSTSGSIPSIHTDAPNEISHRNARLLSLVKGWMGW